MENCSVVIVAGGQKNSTRYNSGTNKIFDKIRQASLLEWSVSAFFSLLNEGFFKKLHFLILTGQQDMPAVNNILKNISNKFPCFDYSYKIIESAHTRMASIDLSLEKITSPESMVFIHDAARPFIQPSSIVSMAKCLLEKSISKPVCCVAAEKSVDSVLLMKNKQWSPFNRGKIIQITTPFAGYCREIILNRKKFSHHKETSGYEDASLASLGDNTIFPVFQDIPNKKVTYSVDIDIMNIMAEKYDILPFSV